MNRLDKSSELFVAHRGKDLIIEVYRIPGRSDLQRCRARAKVIAAREGFRTEPDVVSFDDRASVRGQVSIGPLKTRESRRTTPFTCGDGCGRGRF